jgi:ribose 1,5-bisphosphokinase PhnN
MQAGTLFFIVGASGVGKDTLYRTDTPGVTERPLIDPQVRPTCTLRCSQLRTSR